MKSNLHIGSKNCYFIDLLFIYNIEDTIWVKIRTKIVMLYKISKYVFKKMQQSLKNLKNDF